MASTATEVRAALECDEPEYEAIARTLGPDAVDVVSDVLASDDTKMASRAASLAGYLPAAGRSQVLARAIQHPHYRVRVAAAGALARGTSEDVTELGRDLLTDPRHEVRFWTLRAIQHTETSALREEVTRLATADSAAHVRSLAADVSTHLR